MTLPEFVPIRRMTKLNLAGDLTVFWEIDWKATIEYAFACLEMDGSASPSVAELKAKAIDWLMGRADEFMLCCVQLELDPGEIREQAIWILAKGKDSFIESDVDL